MKKTLWTFGSSNTIPFNKLAYGGEEYIKWKGYIPKIWPEIIAEKLDLELKNLAIGGCDNYTIFELICETINKIKEGDLIIIAWTSELRFRMVSEIDDNKWEYIIPNFDNTDTNFKKTISKNTLNEILYNRKSKKYIDEVGNWTRLIDKAFHMNKVVHWSNFIKHTYIHRINYCEKINAETNGEIDDLHFSEKGNIQLVDVLMNIIEPNSKTLV